MPILLVFVAWKGVGDDARLFFNSSTDGQNFTELAVIPRTGGNSHGPALASFAVDLFVAWKGAGDDASLFFSSSDLNRRCKVVREFYQPNGDDDPRYRWDKPWACACVSAFPEVKNVSMPGHRSLMISTPHAAASKRRTLAE
jgi:hypothetical protein